MDHSSMSWIQLDGVDEFEKGKSVKAWKTWKASFLSTYLIELMAQAGGVLLGAESDFQEDVVFIKVEKMEFMNPPVPDSRLEIEAQVDGLRREGGWFDAKISQGGKRIAEGRVLLMNVGRLKPGGEGPVTFPRELVQGLRRSKELAS